MSPASPVDRHARVVRRASRAATSALLAVAAGTALLSACSLDWGVRGDRGAEASVAEAGPDVGLDASMTDAPPDSGVGDAPAAPDSAACDTLAADVVNARKKARECQLGTGGQCTTTAPDECGCNVVIRTAGSPEATAYANAIAALIGACGKPAACATTACPQLGVPASWACLVAGSDTRCTP